MRILAIWIVNGLIVATRNGEALVTSLFAVSPEQEKEADTSPLVPEHDMELEIPNACWIRFPVQYPWFGNTTTKDPEAGIWFLGVAVTIIDAVLFTVAGVNDIEQDVKVPGESWRVASPG